MEQFIYDMIHMTEGEKLVNYWWLWLAFVVVGVGFAWLLELLELFR